MSVESQVFTLIGVMVGAAASFLVSMFSERIRHQREMRTRWDTHAFDMYARYVVAVVRLARVAGQIAARNGWDPLALEFLDEQDALRALDNAEMERTIAFERVALLANDETLSSAHSLNHCLWNMEWMARGVQPGSPDDWRATVDSFSTALDTFQQHARRSLSVSPGHFKRVVEKPAIDG